MPETKLGGSGCAGRSSASSALPRDPVKGSLGLGRNSIATSVGLLEGGEEYEG